MNVPIELREGLICDEIRREDNGKALLVGVYPGDILMSKIPGKMRLAFWLQGRSNVAGKASIDFELSMVADDDGAASPRAITLSADMGGLSPNTPAVIVFQGVPVEVIESGTLVLRTRVSDPGEPEQWREILSKRVALQTGAAATTPAQ